ncbi:DUF434 domain-containing protein [Candidatus Sumerlaeota bacterium]|nr:DUF434 domain-containing protein [Candidatus Sumerlaeota bacterium]
MKDGFTTLLLHTIDCIMPEMGYNARMPNRQRHRGRHPQDARLFDVAQQAVLRRATADLSWLLSRGYAETSALKLVGDRHALRQRQRKAVQGAACSDADLAHRSSTQTAPDGLVGRRLLIDGFNLLITVECALGGAVLIHGRDGCVRDLAGVHGSWRRMAESGRAIEQIGAALDQLRPQEVVWLLDAPVSNSGRLASFLREYAKERRLSWTVELHNNPDRALIEAQDAICATSDAWVLNETAAWFNLAVHVLEQLNVKPEMIDLSLCST